MIILSATKNNTQSLFFVCFLFCRHGAHIMMAASTKQLFLGSSKLACCKIYIPMNVSFLFSLVLAELLLLLGNFSLSLTVRAFTPVALATNKNSPTSEWRRIFSRSRSSNRRTKRGMSSTDADNREKDDEDQHLSRQNERTMITILGLGSLLSERSSRVTFPNLEKFRLGRVPNYRRVFGHPASIFFQRGLANVETKEYSSLAAEYCEGHPGFICSVFQVPSEGVMLPNGIPSRAFLEREEEFDIVQVPFIDFGKSKTEISSHSKGILCTRFTDVGYVERWGGERFDEHYKKYGIDTIWGFRNDSGLRPCQVYLRHCYLAAKKMGDECFDSFLDETVLVDRTTTVREYVSRHPQVVETFPPPGFEERYSG